MYVQKGYSSWYLFCVGLLKQFNEKFAALLDRLHFAIHKAGMGQKS